MRKGMWSAAAFVVLSSGAALLWVPTVQAADNPPVGMKDQLSYDPEVITVPVDTVVVFRNDGNIQHDAKAVDNSFSTPLLDPGKEHSVTVRGTPGVDIKYFCSVSGHRSAGMEGTIRLVAAGPTPSPPAPTPTPGESTTTTAKAVPGQPATTTTTGKAAAGHGSTTTTTAGGGAPTSTTQAPSVTPTSAPETGGVTTTTTAATPTEGGEEAAADGHGGEHPKSEGDEKSSPLGIAFASVSTLLLIGDLREAPRLQVLTVGSPARKKRRGLSLNPTSFVGFSRCFPSSGSRRPSPRARLPQASFGQPTVRPDQRKELESPRRSPAGPRRRPLVADLRPFIARPEDACCICVVRKRYHLSEWPRRGLVWSGLGCRRGPIRGDRARYAPLRRQEGHGEVIGSFRFPR